MQDNQAKQQQQQQAKEKVKEELMKLQKNLGKSNFKLIHTQSFPYIFQILFSEDTFSSISNLHVDFNGLWIEFSFDEAYPFHHTIQPSRSLFVTQVIPNNNQILPRKLIRLLREGLNFAIEKLHKNGQTVVWEVLLWFEKSGFKQILMKSEFVQSYIAEGTLGESSRRFLIFNTIEKDDPSSEPEEEIEEENSHDSEDEHDHHSEEEEEEEIQLDSLINPPPTISLTNCDHGVILELEDVDFSNVAVLECNNLNIQVQCGRCQQRVDVTNLHSWKEKHLTCHTCSKEMSITFYANAVSGVQQSQQQIDSQEDSYIFAQIELNGCNFWDVMKSNFQSICFECSHVVPMDGLKLRSTNEIACEKCHSKLTVRFRNIRKYTFEEALDALKSIQKASSKVVTAKSSKPKNKSVTTGLKPGEPLPKEGTCKHYKHSHRWLVFPCCNKPYACDDCHDAAETHKASFATQQICGFCSRQQNISTGKCLYCGKALTKKVVSSHGKSSSSSSGGVPKSKLKSSKTSKK